MKEVNEAIYAKEKDRHWLKDHGYTKGKKMCVLYNGEYYEDCPITDVTERTKSVEIYIPQLDKKVSVHYSMLDEGLNPSSIVDTLRYMKSASDYKKAFKTSIKYIKTGKEKYYKKALSVMETVEGGDLYDKAEDLELLATAPHAKKSDAKAYIRDRRDKINQDYVKNGVDKKYYEEEAHTDNLAEAVNIRELLNNAKESTNKFVLAKEIANKYQSPEQKKIAELKAIVDKKYEPRLTDLKENLNLSETLFLAEKQWKNTGDSRVSMSA